MADALTAAMALDVGGAPGILEDALRILGLLGADGVTEPPAPPTFPDEGAVTTPGRPEVAERAIPEPELPAVPLEGAVIIEPLPAEPAAALELTEEVEPLEWLAGAAAPVPYRPPVATVLLRAAVTVLARRARLTRRVDLDTLVDRIASAHPVEVLPMLVERSIGDGLVVFADRCPEMEPYRQDVRFLIDRIRATIGVATTQVRWVPPVEAEFGAAGVGGAGPSEDSVAMTVPDRPALVVSALGYPESASMDPDATSRWRDLLDLLDGSAHGYAVLTPHPGVAAELASAGRWAVAWDDLDVIGRGRG